MCLGHFHFFFPSPVSLFPCMKSYEPWNRWNPDLPDPGTQYDTVRLMVSSCSRLCRSIPDCDLSFFCEYFDLFRGSQLKKKWNIQVLAQQQCFTFKKHVFTLFSCFGLSSNLLVVVLLWGKQPFASLPTTVSSEQLETNTHGLLQVWRCGTSTPYCPLLRVFYLGMAISNLGTRSLRRISECPMSQSCNSPSICLLNLYAFEIWEEPKTRKYRRLVLKKELRSALHEYHERCGIHDITLSAVR